MKTDVNKLKLMIKAVVLSGMAAITALFSCAGTGPTAFDRDAIIMQANLYAGRPVEDIRLLYLVKIIIDSTEMQVTNWETGKKVDTVLYTLGERWVDNAQVTISYNGESWPLTHSDSGYYHEPTGMLIPEVGKTYRIDVYDPEGRHAWAETTVPLPVISLERSRDTFYVDTTGSGGSSNGSGGSSGRSGSAKKTSSGTGSGTGTGSVPYNPDTSTSAVPDSLSRLTVTWDNPDGRYIYFRFERENDPDFNQYSGYFTNTPGLLLSGVYISSGSSGGTSVGSGSGSTILRPFTLNEIGRYKLLVYNPPPASEYWDALVVRADTSHKILDRWTRAFTNVKGGVGYFASFGIDSIYFNIAPWKKEDQ